MNAETLPLGSLAKLYHRNQRELSYAAVELFPFEKARAYPVRATPSERAGRITLLLGLLEIIPEVFLLICRRTDRGATFDERHSRTRRDTRRRDVAAKKRRGGEID